MNTLTISFAATMFTSNSILGLTQAAIDTICNAIGDQNPKIRRIVDSDSNEDVADYTLKYLVTSSLGTRYVLIVSNNKFPLMVSRAVSRLLDTRFVLSPESHHIAEMPIYHGASEGVSYALWLYRIPLSTNRYRKFAQKYFLVPKVRKWLSSVALQTQRNNLTSDELRTNFTEPLGELISNPKFGATLIKASQNAMKRLTSGDFRPVHVLQHGDLWHGNVLIKGSLDLLNPFKSGFIVIDWGGAKVSGYPFFDLVIFSMSCNISPKTTAHHLNLMRNIIRCEPADVLVYVLSALGKLHLELEQFPEHRFIGLCEVTMKYLAAAGLNV